MTCTHYWKCSETRTQEKGQCRSVCLKCGIVQDFYAFAESVPKGFVKRGRAYPERRGCNVPQLIIGDGIYDRRIKRR